VTQESTHAKLDEVGLNGLFKRPADQYFRDLHNVPNEVWMLNCSIQWARHEDRVRARQNLVRRGRNFI
jgi:hypothetical protein